MRFLDVVKSIEKKDINGIYVFYGEEPYLNKMISKKIIQRYLSPVNEYMNLNVFESENLGFDSIVSSCETLPFFSEKRIVLIKGIDLSKENLGKRNVFFESLIKYSENIPKTTILIVEAGQKFMKGKFYNSLKKLDRIFELEKLNRNDLMNFISKGLAKKNISKNVMNYYIDRTGYLVKDSEVELLLCARNPRGLWKSVAGRETFRVNIFFRKRHRPSRRASSILRQIHRSH